jgi:hypothetical protein
MSATAASTRQFPHRRNQDGTFDSICRECAQTVATAKQESDLIDAEQNHNCASDLVPLSTHKAKVKPEMVYPESTVSKLA